MSRCTRSRRTDATSGPTQRDEAGAYSQPGCSCQDLYCCHGQSGLMATRPVILQPPTHQCLVRPGVPMSLRASGCMREE
ncbi:unnamed protein product [Protopolystoma xenopodis]|uniref:Uncharacterized protein n=1 Tax=Protopolystoma xenopodis TaxID=117903 RepID=A0A3S5CJ51_9PLAT|nr:unnamed protein product [Protopolystoma xenopodis]